MQRRDSQHAECRMHSDLFPVQPGCLGLLLIPASKLLSGLKCNFPLLAETRLLQQKLYGLSSKFISMGKLEDVSF